MHLSWRVICHDTSEAYPQIVFHFCKSLTRRPAILGLDLLCFEEVPPHLDMPYIVEICTRKRAIAKGPEI